MHHHLPLTPSVLHGVFSRDQPPVLTVDSGDSVSLSTLDAWWGLEPAAGPSAPRKTLDHPHAKTGHCLTGPIAVRGLLPGDTLEIRMDRLVPDTTGFTEAGGAPWPHYERLGVDQGPLTMLLWSIGPTHATTTLASGRVISLPVSPFLGVIGMPPAGAGDHPTTPPRATGGNLDCTLLTVGTSLFLPVEVAGGLLSLGDGHATQGDGELSNNGIECAFSDIQITLTRHPRDESSVLFLPTPYLRLPDAARSFAVLGLGPTLDAAAYDAGNHLLTLISHTLKCSRHEAIGLASLSAHFRITQMVNRTLGVHALWTPPDP